MKMTCSLLFFILTLFHLPDAIAQNSIQQINKLQAEPALYVAKKIDVPICIDGKMDHTWDLAPWSSAFVDIEGTHQPAPPYKTQFKMLWDEENMYIYARIEEPHVWGTLKKRDAIIYHDNDFEIFLKPNLASPIYYEIEINALNTLMDLMMPKPYRFGGKALMHWDTKAIKSAVHIEGTLNDPSDTDKYWDVEIAIPFKSLGKFGVTATPALNSYWRMNFSRVQWQHEIHDGQYFRKKNNNKLLPEDNWVWSPIGLINMHYPERWGYLFFTQQQTQPPLPPSYRAKKIAWNIHYLLQLYKNKNQNFPSQIKDAEGYDDFLKEDIKDFEIDFTLNKNRSFYQIHLQKKNSPYYFTIDSHGNYTTNHEQ